MHQASPPKNTPGRRRPGRNNTSHRNYASENDMVTYRQTHPDRPATPEKSGSIEHSQSTNAKQRNRHQNKGRNKNGATSPGLTSNAKHDRRSPSFPPSHQPPAFAGATFHNSPLPSALPIPSFLARTTSAPDSPSITSPSQEPSPPTTDSEDGASASPVLRNEESPLEFFFKADRAEKERTRRASSANAAPIAIGPFSPPHDSPISPKVCNTFPKGNGSVQSRRPNVSQRNSSTGIPANELDGTPGEPFGQPFSTPYQERIRAARSGNSSSQPTTAAKVINAQKNKTSILSEDLKRYLFETPPGIVGRHPSPPRQPVPSQPRAAQKLPRGMFPASVLTGNPNISHTTLSHTTQAQSSSTFDSHADQVRRLEDSLRQVLKLNSSA